MLLHYCFWFLLFFETGSFDTLYGGIPPPLLLLLIPSGGAAWLLYSKTITALSDSSLASPSTIPRPKWTVAGMAVSVALLAVLWLPSHSYSLVHAKNPDSLNIEMSRSNCQVGCPVYTVTIHGNGRSTISENDSAEFAALNNSFSVMIRSMPCLRRLTGLISSGLRIRPLPGVITHPEW
jgi:hypothetical protein